MAEESSVLDERTSRQEKVDAQREADREASFEDETRTEEESKNQAIFSMMRNISLHRQKISQSEANLSRIVEEKATLWQYRFAFIPAILKDLLDLVGFSVPLISFLVTSLFTFIIFIALYFAKTHKGVFEMRYFVKKVVVWTVGFITESLLFGINFLPIQTLIVYLIYLIDRSASNDQIEHALSILESAKQMR
jgi:hypothetical protein